MFYGVLGPRASMGGKNRRKTSIFTPPHQCLRFLYFIFILWGQLLIGITALKTVIFYLTLTMPADESAQEQQIEQQRVQLCTHRDDISVIKQQPINNTKALVTPINPMICIKCIITTLSNLVTDVVLLVTLIIALFMNIIALFILW